MRRLVADKKHHHKRHSKKLNKDGKQNHVSFPEFQQNGSAKQFCTDYISEVLNEDDTDPKSMKEEWDSPITFTAKSSLTDESIFSDPGKRMSRGSIDAGDFMRSAPLQQSEFPAWASNKEYLAYNSPSATFLGGLENPRSSVIGLFRRESLSSEPSCSAESTPQRERRGSAGRNTIIFIEENKPESDPLGVLHKQMSVPPLPQPPQTPGQRRQARRGSMLELSSGSITRDIIPEEAYATSSLRRPSWFSQSSTTRRTSLTKQQTFGASLMGNVSSPSPSPSDCSADDEDIECLMKAGF
ncbi:hypothetical protein JTB14_034772 [Gonioctena quinquepunctata]|nr:hypothetical protein JTB14_034772 [Gonioctena quinquepunctata]